MQYLFLFSLLYSYLMIFI